MVDRTGGACWAQHNRMLLCRKPRPRSSASSVQGEEAPENEWGSRRRARRSNEKRKAKPNKQIGFHGEMLCQKITPSAAMHSPCGCDEPAAKMPPLSAVCPGRVIVSRAESDICSFEQNTEQLATRRRCRRCSAHQYARMSSVRGLYPPMHAVCRGGVGGRKERPSVAAGSGLRAVCVQACAAWRRGGLMEHLRFHADADGCVGTGRELKKADEI